MNLYQYYSTPSILDGYEHATKNVPNLAYAYALKIGKAFPEGEQALAKDPNYALRYASDVLDGEFVAGEAAIASNAETAYYYAVDVLNGEFTDGEDAINADPEYKAMYYRFLRKLENNKPYRDNYDR